MPLKRCTTNGKPGWKYGDVGKCYPAGKGKTGKKKAIKQGLAMGNGKLLEDVDDVPERKSRSAFARSVAARPFTAMEAAFDEGKHPRADDGKFGPGDRVTSGAGSASYHGGEKTHRIEVTHASNDTHKFHVGKHPKKPGVQVIHELGHAKTTSYHVKPENVKSSANHHAFQIVAKHTGDNTGKHRHLNAAVYGIANAMQHFANLGDAAGAAVDKAASPRKPKERGSRQGPSEILDNQ